MSESPAARSASENRLIVRAVLRTDVGKVRSENQDFGMVSTSAADGAGSLLVVADGMGGHRGGATASRLATETVKEAFSAAGGTGVAEALVAALAQANAKIWGEAQANPDLRGMGTTTSALAVRDGQGWFAHVGDSRIYLVRGDEIRQLTDDHSLVASMVREGLLSANEAENHPRRNVLQRSMGVGADVQIDVRGPLEIREDDTFILCSDGLHGVLREDEIQEVAKLPIDTAADEFVRRALDKGAPDNVTVIVARVEREAAADADKTLVESDDRALFEDTIRERAGSAQPADATAPASSAVADPAPRRPALSIVKWTLLFILVLGAAGAGIFWAQQQRFAPQGQSSSR